MLSAYPCQQPEGHVLVLVEIQGLVQLQSRIVYALQGEELAGILWRGRRWRN